jgi:hypothetical protein
MCKVFESGQVDQNPDMFLDHQICSATLWRSLTEYAFKIQVAIWLATYL